MILRGLMGMGVCADTGTRSSPAKAALYGVAKVCGWYSGFSATTTQSTRMPGTLTWRGFSEPRSATRSTCTITMPPELRTAIRDRKGLERERSRSIVTLPSGSAVVPRIIAT